MYEISVIIPMYNSEKWIKKCLESIINQTIFKQMQVIIIDDGSRDTSCEICNNYIKKYSNIELLKISNSGVSNARNIGIEKSVGKYISFLDSDDWIELNFYEQSLKKAREGDFDIVCYGKFIEYEDKTIMKNSREALSVSSKEYLELLYRDNIVDQTVTSKVFKSEIIKNVKFDSNIKIGEDYLFLVECLLRARKIAIENRCMYHYFMNDKSAMRKKFNVDRFDSILVSQKITEIVSKENPELKNLLISSEVDYLCRVLCDIDFYGLKKDYEDKYMEIKNKIKKYSILKKYIYSSKKHFIAFLITRINPKIYNFIKENLKMQYK